MPDPQKISDLDEALSVGDNDLVEVSTATVPKLSKKAKKSTLLSGVYKSGGTDVPVTDGGTGASDAAAARTNLGAAAATDLTSHTANTSNPHSVTKTQVGLSNVPNTDATDRANHIGTQAISTVSGLQTALDDKVVGPASATDNAIARFDSTTGKLVQNSSITVSDGGSITMPGTLAAGTGLSAPAASISGNISVTGTVDGRDVSTDGTKLDGVETAADVTDPGNVGSSIHGSSAKTTPVDADAFPLIDSAASNTLKKVTWSNVKATLKTYFDTLYAAVSHTHAQSDITNLTTDLASRVPTSRTVNGQALSSNVTLNIDDVAPTQTGNSGKVLQTDGANASWETLDPGDSLPDQTGNSGKFLTTDGADAAWESIPGGGDMLAATYDPNSVAADAFDQDNMADGTTNKNYTATEKTKLAGISTSATANDTDANLKNRSNHTGTQTLSTISDVTASAAELNLMDGVTATTTELNYTDGVTSAIQTQLDAKAPTASPTFTGTVSGVTKAHVGLGNVTNDAQIKAADLIDEDNMASDSATKVPTQQSVKAYVDTEIAGVSAGSGISWSEVTGTSQSASVNNGYIANNAGLVTVTLPTTAAVGSIVEVAGKGAGLWKLAQNSGESVHFGDLDTTTGTGGSITATHRRDAIRVMCTVADTEWTVLSSVGNLEVA